jgi:hypothetical protein
MANGKKNVEKREKPFRGKYLRAGPEWDHNKHASKAEASGP